MKRGPSPDEVGLQFLQQMLGHSSRQRLKALDAPAQSEESEAKEEEGLDAQELERLLASQSQMEA